MSTEKRPRGRPPIKRETVIHIDGIVDEPAIKEAIVEVEYQRPHHFKRLSSYFKKANCLSIQMLFKAEGFLLKAVDHFGRVFTEVFFDGTKMKSYYCKQETNVFVRLQDYELAFAPFDMEDRRVTLALIQRSLISKELDIMSGTVPERKFTIRTNVLPQKVFPQEKGDIYVEFDIDVYQLKKNLTAYNRKTTMLKFVKKQDNNSLAMIIYESNAHKIPAENKEEEEITQFRFDNINVSDECAEFTIRMPMFFLYTLLRCNIANQAKIHLNEDAFKLEYDTEYGYVKFTCTDE